MPRWHDGPLDTLDPAGEEPVVWAVSDGGADSRRDRTRALVAQLAAVPADCVALSRSAAGAPQVASPPGWYVSLSRRGGRCLVAAARQPIAVDRECLDDAPPLWDMLTAEEAAVVRALAPAAQPGAWLRRWTVKEAHAKLVGTPRALAPEHIATTILDASRAVARCAGTSHCWTRYTADAIETVALWHDREPVR